MSRNPTESESAQSLESKQYSYVDEQDALAWFECVVGEGKIFKDSRQLKVVGDVLYDGEYLCKFMRKLQLGGSETKVNKPGNDCQRKQHIEMFLDECRICGIPDDDLFDVSDLYERKNIQSVVKTIIAMKRFLGNRHDQPRGYLDTPHPCAHKHFSY